MRWWGDEVSVPTHKGVTLWRKPLKYASISTKSIESIPIDVSSIYILHLYLTSVCSQCHLQVFSHLTSHISSPPNTSDPADPALTVTSQGKLEGERGKIAEKVRPQWIHRAIGIQCHKLNLFCRYDTGPMGIVSIVGYIENPFLSCKWIQ